MVNPSSEEITALLVEWGKGDREALDKLVPLVASELRRLARRQLRGESAVYSLQTTGLVHEAYLRLVDQNRTSLRGRAHFFAVAAQAMRRILVDYARRRLAKKRGGGYRWVELNEALDAELCERSEILIELENALSRLSEQDPVEARVLELRVFGGLTVEETAQALDISPRTVRREFSLARAWVYREMKAACGPRG
jgi:RNA polymerase sigma-70 factor, ECF subfamily